MTLGNPRSFHQRQNRARVLPEAPSRIKKGAFPNPSAAADPWARGICAMPAPPSFFYPRPPKKKGKKPYQTRFSLQTCRKKADAVQCFVMSEKSQRNVRAKRKKATPYRDFSQNRGQGSHKAQKRLLYYARTRI